MDNNNNDNLNKSSSFIDQLNQQNQHQHQPPHNHHAPPHPQSNYPKQQYRNTSQYPQTQTPTTPHQNPKKINLINNQQQQLKSPTKSSNNNSRIFIVENQSISPLKQIKYYQYQTVAKSKYIKGLKVSIQGQEQIEIQNYNNLSSIKSYQLSKEYGNIVNNKYNELKQINKSIKSIKSKQPHSKQSKKSSQSPLNKTFQAYTNYSSSVYSSMPSTTTNRNSNNKNQTNILIKQQESRGIDDRLKVKYQYFKKEKKGQQQLINQNNSIKKKSKQNHHVFQRKNSPTKKQPSTNKTNQSQSLTKPTHLTPSYLYNKFQSKIAKQGISKKSISPLTPQNIKKMNQSFQDIELNSNNEQINLNKLKQMRDTHLQSPPLYYYDDNTNFISNYKENMGQEQGGMNYFVYKYNSNNNMNGINRNTAILQNNLTNHSPSSNKKKKGISVILGGKKSQIQNQMKLLNQINYNYQNHNQKSLQKSVEIQDNKNKEIILLSQSKQKKKYLEISLEKQRKQQKGRQANTLNIKIIQTQNNNNNSRNKNNNNNLHFKNNSKNQTHNYNSNKPTHPPPNQDPQTFLSKKLNIVQKINDQLQKLSKLNKLNNQIIFKEEIMERDGDLKMEKQREKDIQSQRCHNLSKKWKKQREEQIIQKEKEKNNVKRSLRFQQQEKKKERVQSNKNKKLQIQDTINQNLQNQHKHKISTNNNNKTFKLSINQINNLKIQLSSKQKNSEDCLQILNQPIIESDQKNNIKNKKSVNHLGSLIQNINNKSLDNSLQSHISIKSLQKNDKSSYVNRRNKIFKPQKQYSSKQKYINSQLKTNQLTTPRQNIHLSQKQRLQKLYKKQIQSHNKSIQSKLFHYLIQEDSKSKRSSEKKNKFSPIRKGKISGVKIFQEDYKSQRKRNNGSIGKRFNYIYSDKIDKLNRSAEDLSGISSFLLNNNNNQSPSKPTPKLSQNSVQNILDSQLNTNRSIIQSNQPYTKLSESQIRHQINKIKLYDFIQRYMTNYQLQEIMRGYIHRSIPTRKWSLMIIDEVYKRIRAKQSKR